MSKSGRLTTHVLDTARGKPAQGLCIDFYRVEGEERRLLCTAETNSDGRIDGPLAEGAGFTAGTYELVFHAGDYLRTAGVALSEPAFLDLIPLRFGVADPESHYHVPLLLSPYGYSTYRGS
ncbi:hydroxyisourate hydrolase [Sinorhizobium alkalisoli]|uniref:5-hydroxyisourate hydrolase n=1 Tax=Sinorhizobium alkalisoli TaxID=1752398 RepID=A0A1E3VDF5_9HYPH|nr:hydroxyisourate hydrolase [Sinorhizobium alkalisoli]MCA1490782.1 hydroxyisourate hydrolase [Ensifer sp. NBAIM29]MCG5479368.1 hydroxyisourate hydrolase [Sinorhizobium alkalisoli]ODR91602.1 hydroxyisourate hydrolase [Sinorhizobium alkalisoli]QFI67298.1 Transthyretin family protein [Sinorhizobium alkalisoli]